MTIVSNWPKIPGSLGLSWHLDGLESRYLLILLIYFLTNNCVWSIIQVKVKCVLKVIDLHFISCISTKRLKNNFSIIVSLKSRACKYESTLNGNMNENVLSYNSLIDHCLVNSTLHCTQLRLLSSGKDIKSKLYFISIVVKNTLKNHWVVMTTFYYYSVNHQSGLQKNTFSKSS